MIVCQVLSRIDDSMHVSLHQLSNNVDVFEAGTSRRFSHIQDLDDILVVKKFEQSDLTHDSFRIYQIFESFGHLFDCNLDLVVVIVGAANNAISPMSDLLYILKLFFHAESCTCKI